jgi:hypothetical protein
MSVYSFDSTSHPLSFDIDLDFNGANRANNREQYEHYKGAQEHSEVY